MRISDWSSTCALPICTGSCGPGLDPLVSVLTRAIVPATQPHIHFRPLQHIEDRTQHRIDRVLQTLPDLVLLLLVILVQASPGLERMETGRVGNEGYRP